MKPYDPIPSAHTPRLFGSDRFFGDLWDLIRNTFRAVTIERNHL